MLIDPGASERLELKDVCSVALHDVAGPPARKHAATEASSGAIVSGKSAKIK